MKLKYIGIFAIVALLGGCFGPSSSEPDLKQVLDRAKAALVNFDKYLKEKNIEKASNEHMGQLTTYMQKAMNLEPRFYKDGLIAMKLLKDAKFEGYNDANKNGKADDGEKKLFYIEVDAANKRLLATAESTNRTVGSGLTGLATGFLAGALISNLMGRQQASGITRNSFNNRKVTPASSYARGRARSGGRFGGK